MCYDILVGYYYSCKKVVQLCSALCQVAFVIGVPTYRCLLLLGPHCIAAAGTTQQNLPHASADHLGGKEAAAISSLSLMACLCPADDRCQIGTVED